MSALASMLRSVARRVLPARVRSALRRLVAGEGIVGRCEVLEGAVPPALLGGWRDPAVAARQDEAFAGLLRDMLEGRPRADFVALASAVRETGLEAPRIIEVGCGSGWNAEVLAHLLGKPVRYVGVDYSPAMTALGRRRYPRTSFVVGDATALPFRDGSCDILVSGTVLMHLLGYEQAIREGRRVARKWCVLHTVPTLETRSTTLLEKGAYGSPVVEIVFNEGALRKLIEESGMRIRSVFESVSHGYLERVLGERVAALTFLCERLVP